jgi:very-short-patch-repair endonuclease
MSAKSKCLGCNKEAKTKKGWCSIECYRKNQNLIKNKGRFYSNQSFSKDHKLKISEASKKWHSENPELSVAIIKKMNDPIHNVEKSHKKELHPRWIERIEIQCKNCLDIIKIPPYKKTENNFCSKKCYLEYHSSGKHKLGRKSKWIEKKCLLCGEKFQVPPCRKDTAKFCSRQCHCLHNHKNMKRQNTGIEIKLAKILKELNLIFENQKIIEKITIPDFFIEPNICIYADGDYWHNLDSVKSKDIIINKYLNENGYKVIRFSEESINNNPNKIKTELCVRLSQ